MAVFFAQYDHMTQLPVWQETVVDESEIDSLGHMNVRFYLSRVDSAFEEILQRAGLVPGQGEQLRRFETYSRFLKEQFSGNRLETRGGLIASENEVGVTGYFEIRNQQSGDLAACFIVRTGLIDAASQTPRPLRNDMLASEPLIDIPAYAQPRSLSLNVPQQVSLEELESLISDDPTPGMMSGRRENLILPEDCDAQGRLREEVELMFIMHRPMPGQPQENFGPPQLVDSGGRRYSWAMMETRQIVFAKPHLNDPIVSLSADVAFGEKWRQSRRWMFVKDSGVLLGVHDSVGVCMDLDARRAMPIPADVRQVMERNCLPQLG